MNEKTAKMIDEALKQKFGVEIEMNHITREEAASLAAAYFGTAHYEYTGGRNGYNCWSAWDADGREWKFESDSSIKGPLTHACEMVSPILSYGEDIELLLGLVRKLRHAGAVANYLQGCGLHCHVSGEGHTAQSLRNLVNIFSAHEDLIFQSLQIDSRRIAHYCSRVNPRFLAELNRKKPKTLEQFADIWYTSQGCSNGRNARYNPSRYAAINLHSFFYHSTIEFRFGQFNPPANGKKNGLHCGELRTFIQLCLAMSQMAKTVKTASPKPVVTDNPRYAMRTWLLRLGFIGDEFATARDVLTRNLEGDAAFRYGRAA